MSEPTASHVHNESCTHIHSVGDRTQVMGIDHGGASEVEVEGDPSPAHRVVLPSNVLPLDSNMQELVWVGTQGQKITIIDGISHLKFLKVLCLRSNLLRSMVGVGSVKVSLEELELYDNLLRELEDLDGANKLRLLDVSYNRIATLEGLAGRCPALEVLYCASNRLKDPLPGVFSACALTLTRLDLGSNSLPSMEGLECLVNLEELWLGKNKITEIKGLQALSKLRILDVQSNRLTRIGGLGGGASGEGIQHPHLQELYLGHQGITVLEGLDALPALKVFDCTGNAGVTEIRGLEGCPGLTDLWAGYTGVASFDSVLSGVANCTSLQVLYLEHSPLAKDWEYRIRLCRGIPSLEQLDATSVSRWSSSVKSSSSVESIGGGGGQVV